MWGGQLWEGHQEKAPRARLRFTRCISVGDRKARFFVVILLLVQGDTLRMELSFIKISLTKG